MTFVSRYAVSTINLVEHLTNINNFFLNSSILLWRDTKDAGLEWLLGFQRKSVAELQPPLLHITTLFMTTSFPFCLNYITYIDLFNDTHQPLSISAKTYFKSPMSKIQENGEGTHTH